MRAVLVVNPKATGTTARTRDVLATALAADLKVEVAMTERRGHAIDLARNAASDGVELVVALGGDGTVNEVINGLLAAGPRPGTPTLGVVPGGCANVLARSLGLPTDPVEATAVLLEAVRGGHSRPIGLGRLQQHTGAGVPRYFAFCAGLGLDAATVRRVESRRRAGSRVTPWRYARAALAEYATSLDHRRPSLTLHLPGGEPVPVFLGLVCNTAPWTYLGDRPVNPCPQASFGTGLDVFALTRMYALPTLRILAQLFTGGPHGRRVLSGHDLAELTITAAGRPQPLQVDGDFLGVSAGMSLQSVPRALRVLALPTAS